MEKYRNGRVVRRVGGRFAAQPTLAAQGYSVNADAKQKVCAACGHEARPILACWKCSACGHLNTTTEEQP